MKLLIITQKVDKNDQLLGFFIDWISLFAQKFEKITILCLEKGEFRLPENVKVLSLGKGEGVSKLGQLFNFYKHIFTLKNGYDAVFAHMNPIWVVLGGFWWQIMKKKIFLWYTSGGVTFKLKLAEKFADTVLTASKESFRLPSKKVVITGHGIDTDFFKPDETKKIQDGKLRILSVGRIAQVKNYDILINAAKTLANRNFPYKISIVGEAPLKKDLLYEKRIKEKIKVLGLMDQFDFLGKIDHKDLPSYYQSNNLFVHLSKTGSLDKTILEAMACGMNVLSSNDWSRHSLPLELIFDGDNASELADKIENLSRNNFGKQLREYVVKNHNLDNLIEKIKTEITKSKNASS